MNPTTLAAFQDELMKIAEPGSPAAKANALFGLPLGPPYRKNTRLYDKGSTSASEKPPVDTNSQANISMGGAQYPAAGPGGV